MPTPASGQISMNDVFVETGLTRNMDNFFDVATVGGGGGGMYHNLAMGPSNNLSFKQAIYDQYNSGQNMRLSYWYNYSQNPDMLIDWDFNNSNTENDVTVNIGFYDPASTSYNMFASFTVNNSGGSDVQSNYNSAQLPSSYNNGLYEVVCDVAAIYVGGGRPPGAGVNNNTTSASDTDGVGPGTTRVANNITNFDSTNPITQFPLVQGNISGTNIYINKRTSVSVQFN
jgi:hypothetical protein